MLKQLLKTRPNTAILLYLLTPQLLEYGLQQMNETIAATVRANQFGAKTGETLVVITTTGQKLMLAGLGTTADEADIAALPAQLGTDNYVLGFAPSGLERTRLAINWLLGCYRFERYQRNKTNLPKLWIPGADIDAALAHAEAVALARDLINTPANDMGTEALEQAIRDLGKRFKAKVTSVVGDELLRQNYPMIHAVGRAADQEPRLVHLVWGDERNPAISLVGKGVVFDTGGLNIKSGGYMKLMKKDMGGAANALACAQLIMQANLPVFLNVFIPIVDNAISKNAYRPSDILPSRMGISVEIENTDAEGRLILADALTRAVEDQPELLVNFATLTGAARTALGPDLTPYFTASTKWAARLETAAQAVNDPVWRMPLWAGYDASLNSDIADICHTSLGPMAGSITAALFLQRFVADTPWIHFDIYAWVSKERPGHPIGGEAQGSLAVFAMLNEKYGP